MSEQKVEQKTETPPTKGVKLVKIRAKSPIRVDGKILQPGEVAEVSEEMANDFCMVLTGHFAFSGTRYEGEQLPRNKYQRAERVA